MIWIALNPRINGVFYQTSNQAIGGGWNNNGNQYILLSWSGIMNLNAGDAVTFTISYNTFSGNCSFGHFSGHLIG